MWPLDIITDTTRADQISTQQHSLPPTCVARAVEVKPSLPPRKPVNRPQETTSTLKEIRVRTIVSIILEPVVTEASMTRTLPLLKCVVDAVGMEISVQTRITTSSTQPETRASPTSPQMTAMDNSTRRVSQLKNSAAVVVVVFSGFVARVQILLHWSVSIRLPTTVLNTLKTHRHVECTCVWSQSLFSSLFVSL